MAEIFQEQTTSILKIISSNHAIENEKIDKLTEEIRINNKEFQKEIDDIKHSLEFLQEEINATFLARDKKIEKLHEGVKNIKIDQNNTELQKLQKKITDLEDRTRRNNLRIDGIQENENESWSDCEAKVKKLFSDSLKVKDVEIQRVHRVGKKKENRPRTIVMKLLRWKDKEMIMVNVRKLKGKYVFINEDFSIETLELRKKLWEQVKQYRQEGKYAVLNYDKIYVRDRY